MNAIGLSCNESEIKFISGSYESDGCSFIEDYVKK